MSAPLPVTVVKLGGRVQRDPALVAAVAAAWRARPGALLLVHGGGDEASTLARALGREPHFEGGRRVTGAEDLDMLRMALSGVANKRLVAALGAAGVPALGLSGEDGGLLQAATPAAMAPLGHVGQVERVHATLLRQLLDSGWLPVVSPLASDAARPGEALNVNGDDAAAAIAVALGAAELLLVSDVAGVRVPSPSSEMPDAMSACARLDADEARALVSSGVARDGMAAKLEAALAALDGGVPRVRVGDAAAITDPSRGTAIVPVARHLRSAVA